MNDQKVPEVDINAPLPPIEEPQADEIMIKARREWYVGVGIFVVFVMIVGGVVWGYGQLTQGAKPSSEKLEIVVSATPSPTPTVVEVKPIYAVWNGSGVAGEAGKLADKLKESGREVVEIKNAPENIVGSQVEISTELASQRSLIEEELNKMGIKVASWMTDLPSGLEYNIRIVIGK